MDDWRKSSRTGGGDNSNCVEARLHEGEFQVRDSKLGETSPVIDLTAEDFNALLKATQR